jgi:hypothetical protein
MADLIFLNGRVEGYFALDKDFHMIELEASKEIPWDDAEVLSEYDAISDEDIVYESYRPEQIVEALKKATELLEQGWVHVKLKFIFRDKETKSNAIFIIGRDGYDPKMRVSSWLDVVLKEPKEEGGGNNGSGYGL